MQDANTEFPYQLFQPEHKSYYGTQDIQALDACKTVANVGWLLKLVGISLSNYCRPPIINQSKLAEIDISEAYTGALTRINAIPLSTSSTSGRSRARASTKIQPALRLPPDVTESTTRNNNP